MPTTPYSELLDEGNYRVTMPQQVVVGTDTYYFVSWENGSTDPVRVISVTTSDVTIAANYQVTPPTPSNNNYLMPAILIASAGVIIYLGVKK